MKRGGGDMKRRLKVIKLASPSPWRNAQLRVCSVDDCGRGLCDKTHKVWPTDFFKPWIFYINWPRSPARRQTGPPVFRAAVICGIKDSGQSAELDNTITWALWGYARRLRFHPSSASQSWSHSLGFEPGWRVCRLMSVCFKFPIFLLVQMKPREYLNTITLAVDHIS